MTNYLQIIHAAWFTPMRRGRWGLTVYLRGGVGIGKSTMVEDAADACGLPCVMLSPALHGEGAFGVVPVPEGKGDKMVLRTPRPSWAEAFDATGRGVVFVDEINQAPNALQPPLMGLLQDRRVGGCQLPPGVRTIAAGNPPTGGAGGFEVNSAVANRMGHLDWPSPNVEDRLRWSATTEDVVRKPNPASVALAEEERVLAHWPGAWAQARGLEAAFLTRRPELLCAEPPAGDPKASGPFPTPRSWEFATRAYASARVHSLTGAEREVFVGSFVGEGAAGELFAFAANLDLPDPADVLDGKVTFRHNPKRADRTAAVLSACSALVAPTSAENRDARATALWAIVHTMAKAGDDRDLLVPVMQQLVQARLSTSTESRLALAELSEVISAAKLGGAQL